MSSTLTRSAPPAAGHNSGHLSLAEQLSPDLLTAQWELDHAAMLRKRKEHEAAYERLIKRFGGDREKRIQPEVKCAEDVALITDLAREINATVGVAAKAHTPAKAPFLAAGRAADAFFKSAFEDLADKAKVLLQLGSVYTKREEARLRREAEEEAARKRAEADRAAEEARAAEDAARRSGHADIIETALAAQDDAVAASEAADKAARVALAPAADFSRTRTDRGAVSSLTSVWKFEVQDLSKIPREWLMLDEGRVGQAIRRKDNPVRDVPGLKIYEDKQLRVS